MVLHLSQPGSIRPALALPWSASVTFLPGGRKRLPTRMPNQNTTSKTATSSSVWMGTFTCASGLMATLFRISELPASNQAARWNYHLFLALEHPIQALNKAIVGTTVAHLGDMHIKTIQIVWPPSVLLSRVGEVLEPLSEQIITLKQQNQNLRRTRDLLLPRLLSGEVNLSSKEETNNKSRRETEITAGA